MSENSPHPKVYWLTGLSASGKTTIATLLLQKLKTFGVHPILIDGDEIRTILNKNHALNPCDRLELGYTYAKLAKLLYDQGFVVIVATISMFEEIRQWNRENIEYYIEVYLKVSEEERRKRNPKKLYTTEPIHAMVHTNKLDYEEPQNADLVFEEIANLSPKDIVDKILTKGDV